MDRAIERQLQGPIHAEGRGTMMVNPWRPSATAAGTTSWEFVFVSVPVLQVSGGQP